ncbi:DNA polymerase [Alteromonas phage vB_AemP_PT15-A5]|nr:DNA polymerase [Alteromonas phage vB_AemP_PT15-A5]
MLNDLRYIHFGAAKSHYKVVIMIKEEGLDKAELQKHFVEPLKVNTGLIDDDFIAVNVKYSGKTAKVNADIKPWLTYLASLISADYWLVADSAYFKQLTGAKKTAHLYGSEMNATFPDYENSKAFLSVNPKAIFFDSKNQGKLDLSVKGLKQALLGETMFEDFIETEQYPDTAPKIKAFLDSLYKYPVLSCDIEGFSLKHYKARIGTIAFAWNKHEGGAFTVDYQRYVTGMEGGYYEKNDIRRQYLKEFFYKYLVESGNKIIWHNISYDVKVLIWELMMDGRHVNQKEMLVGLEMFTNNDKFEDTKIIAYAATNSCDGNDLSLKSLALPFAGNYALEDDAITDISTVGQSKLLKYNLIDTLCTWYVYDTYYPKMVADNQLKVYEEVLKPSVKVLMQAELHGMPLNMDKVLEAESKLGTLCSDTLDRILNNPHVKAYTEYMRAVNYINAHKSWKTKTLPIESDTFDFTFNPNSDPRLGELLYSVLELPVLDYTKNKAPAVGNKTLKKLINHTDDESVKSLLNDLREYGKAMKVLTSFIPAFKNAYQCPDTGHYYLMGNFNIGGTVSGRLSSSDPNLQNIPSGSEYAKLIKECFEAPKGWLMVGLDFNSLEDYISALTTKDPNKLKVYTDGYDGHSLRAFSYWKEKFPFDEITPELSFAVKKDPVLDAIRSASKAPTFALTYQGTWMTLMKNCGFSEEMAKSIEANFKELYKVSIDYINKKLEEASKTGFVEVAFGLKVRTPAIKKSLWGSSHTPKEALAEGRTAGNACGQSYGLLNNRAGIDFQQRTLNSKYALNIFPIAHIHDAQYFIVRKDPELLAWMNKELVECVQWQELPEIQHDTVKLGGELSVFYPHWANEIVIPNDLLEPTELKSHLNKNYKEYKDALKQTETSNV